MVADNAATLTRTSAHYEGVVNVRERSPQTVVMRHQSTFLRPLRGARALACHWKLTSPSSFF